MQEGFFDQPVKALASAEYTAFNQHLTVAEALAQARERGVAQQIIYFYVVDDEQRLAGVVPVRRLLLAPPEARLDSIMIARVAAIPETATALEACEMFMLHRLMALPVVALGLLSGCSLSSDITPPPGLPTLPPAPAESTAMP